MHAPFEFLGDNMMLTFEPRRSYRCYKSLSDREDSKKVSMMLIFDGSSLTTLGMCLMANSNKLPCSRPMHAAADVAQALSHTSSEGDQPRELEVLLERRWKHERELGLLTFGEHRPKRPLREVGLALDQPVDHEDALELFPKCQLQLLGVVHPRSPPHLAAPRHGVPSLRPKPVEFETLV